MMDVKKDLAGASESRAWVIEMKDLPGKERKLSGSLKSEKPLSQPK